MALAAQANRPFLLLAFLWAFFSKEKRLNGFAIKGLLTLFSLILKPASFLSDLRQPFANAKPKAKKALQKRNGVFCAHDGNPQSSFYLLRGTPTPRGRPLLKKRCKTLALVCANIPINPNLPFPIDNSIKLC